MQFCRSSELIQDMTKPSASRFASAILEKFHLQFCRNSELFQDMTKRSRLYKGMSGPLCEYCAYVKTFVVLLLDTKER